jgi:hypothetical protein
VAGSAAAAAAPSAVRGAAPTPRSCNDIIKLLSPIERAALLIRFSHAILSGISKFDQAPIMVGGMRPWRAASAVMVIIALSAVADAKRTKNKKESLNVSPSIAKVADGEHACASADAINANCISFCIHSARCWHARVSE